MIRRLIGLRRALAVLLAVGAIAPSCFAANSKVIHSSANSWLTGVSVPSTSRGLTHAGDAVSLNPQPLPPRTTFSTSSFSSAVSLNPQPLPPRIGNSANFGH